MKKTPAPVKNNKVKKGYNENNPGQPQGAFPPASGTDKPGKDDTKSNTADKKKKEEQR